MATVVEAAPRATALDQADCLGEEARAEIDSYHGMLRRAGVHLFRAGRCLFEAKSLVKESSITWADWLRRHQIADSTARQAIDLYRNAKAKGHEEIDLEGLTITDAKIRYGIVAPRPRRNKDAAPPEPAPSKDNTSIPDAEDITPPLSAESVTPPRSPEEGHGTPPRPPVGEVRSHEAKSKDERPREVFLRDLEEIYGEETEELPFTLPLTVMKLLDILMLQEEVEQQGQVISRAVREYWLRHGDPANFPTWGQTAVSEPDPSHSEVTA